MTELQLRLLLCLVGALLVAASASGEGIEIQQIKLPRITGPARWPCGLLGVVLLVVGVTMRESPTPTPSPPPVATVTPGRSDGVAIASPPPSEPLRPPPTEPIVKNETPTLPTRTAASPEDFVRAYYDDLRRHDAAAALRKWQSPSDKTRRAIENTGSIQLDDVKRLDGDTGSSSAHVWVDTSGRTIDGAPGRWKVTLNLISVGGEWRISSMSK